MLVWFGVSPEENQLTRLTCSKGDRYELLFDCDCDGIEKKSRLFLEHMIVVWFCYSAYGCGCIMIVVYLNYSELIY